MKKILLPLAGNYYKANLHCHTVFSDGRQTPEEVKEAYREKGYSVVAYTDHDVFIPHPELTDDTFLALHGFEAEVNENKNWEDSPKTCHVCYIAGDSETRIQPFYNPGYLFSNAQNHKDEVQYDREAPFYVRSYTAESVCEMMEMGRKAGFFVTYNHPSWSLETAENYLGYHGMHAMEIVNFGCLVAGYPDENGAQYDEILRGGEQIYCIATDDNHRLHDRFGGFTMIAAEKLEYKAVTDALFAGKFYASEGPKILGLWVEDGNVHIRTEGVRRIVLISDKRFARSAYAASPDAPLTEATFPIPADATYFRLEVMGMDGLHAYTNAYSPAEVLE